MAGTPTKRLQAHHLQAEEFVQAGLKLLKNKRFHDLSLICGDGRVVRANRSYIAARSEFFESLLFGPFSESSTAEVRLPTARGPALELVLYWLCTLSLPEQGDAETALEACQLAQQFQLPELQAALVEQLAASMASNQIGMVLDRAASAGLQELELLALQRCSTLVIKPGSFTGFTHDALVLCLSASHLSASESSILEAVIHWGREQLASAGAAPASANRSGLRSTGSGGFRGLGPASPTLLKKRGKGSTSAKKKRRPAPQDNNTSLADRAEADAEDVECSEAGCFEPVVGDRRGLPIPCSGHSGGMGVLSPGSTPMQGALADSCEEQQGSKGANNALQLADVLQDMLPHLHLDCIPGPALASICMGTGLLDAEQLQAMPRDAASCDLSSQYTRRPWDVALAGSQVTHIGVDTLEFNCYHHQGMRSRHCLKTGVFVFHLVVEKYCSCTWVGLVDETADMSTWLGNQKGAWMMGSNGCLAHNTPTCTCPVKAGTHCPLSCCERVYFEEKSYHVLPYGSSWTEDGTRIAVHVDMNLRTCSFEVNGQHFGQAFYNLPAEVYPAVSMRDGGRVKFAACLQAQ